LNILPNLDAPIMLDGSNQTVAQGRSSQGKLGTDWRNESSNGAVRMLSPNFKGHL
jgi:hypothetical protein